MREKDTKIERKTFDVSCRLFEGREGLSSREQREDDRALAIARPQKKPG